MFKRTFRQMDRWIILIGQLECVIVDGGKTRLILLDHVRT